MKYLQPFQVFPTIPESLSFLDVLSRNLWWSWQHDAKELFRRIDPKLWRASGRNPIVFSTMIPKERLEELSKDGGFLVHQKRVKEHFENALLPEQTLSDSPAGPGGSIAYFSMEFGIHECLPLFAGGLGILAGDHLKAASDLMLPLTGVSLLYRQGYFRQFLNQDGMQQEEYPEVDLYTFPIERALDLSGKELFINISGPNGGICAQVWKLMVGRASLFLIDTNQI
ncbi:MAG: glycogen phosphorylase, partial [Thermodesulfobacteriota bacterium]|nr:glycogen phosphorylase [Thermodesulfobacteriota bacterium]